MTWMEHLTAYRFGWSLSAPLARRKSRCLRQFTYVGHVIQPCLSDRIDACSRGETFSRKSPHHSDEGRLSRQLPTRPLPVAPVPIGYCGRNRRFVLRQGSHSRIEQSLQSLSLRTRSFPTFVPLCVGFLLSPSPACFHRGPDAVPSEDHSRWPPCSAVFFSEGRKTETEQQSTKKRP